MITRWTDAPGSQGTRLLRALHFLSDRFSHAVRSPLGVARGVIDDAARGHPLSAEDFADGQAALAKILSQLDLLHDFSSQPILRLEEHAFADLLTRLVEEGATEPPLSFEGCDNCADLTGRLDIDVALRALRGLVRYLAPRVSRGKISLSLGSVGQSALLRIRFIAGLCPELRRASSLRQVLELDHALDALATLYAYAVFEALSWSDVIETHGEEISIVIEAPLVTRA